MAVIRRACTRISQIGLSQYSKIAQNNLILKPWKGLQQCKLQTANFSWPGVIRFIGTLTPRLQTMKIDTAEYHALFTDELKQLVNLFDKNGYELRIAGGAVRDLLMGKPPHDVDFASTATPDEMKTMFEKEGIRMINMKGDKHGTVTCRLNDKENFEITTLRIDVVTDGRHAEVEFTKDWEKDALRRDLTINSMFLDFEGTIYDYFNGREDLAKKKVCFVGNAEERIQEDYLRILRYFRFYGRIADHPNQHEQSTLDAIQENMHGLAGISGERIWVELRKILTGCHANSLFRTMMSLGIGQYIGLPSKVNCDQFDEVYARCQHLQPHHMTLLTSVLDQEEQVYQLNERIRMSKEELRTGVFIILHRSDKVGQWLLRYCQDLMCDTVGKEPKTKDRIVELLKYWGEGKVLEEFKAWNLPKFPVTGHALLERGVKRGPELAKNLSKLRQLWKDSGYTATTEDLLSHLESLKPR